MQNVNVLDWLRLSSDINLIKNSWGIVPSESHKNGIKYDTTKELKVVVKKTWYSLPPIMFQKTIYTVPDILLFVRN